MKFIYLLPVLAVSAALGATNTGFGLGARTTQPLLLVTPPWLDDEWQAEAVGGDDPHAGLYAAEADGDQPAACSDDAAGNAECASCAEGASAGPAGAPAGDDPHAGLYAGDNDPHAGLYAGDDDPHAGLYAGDDDPHAGLYAGDDDPHAGLVEPASASAPVERSHAANGKTVAEVFASRNALAQTKIRVRGTVVKLTEGVLGKAYLHLRDGTGTTESADNDLTVTSTEAFSLGETVEVEGQLAVDQDVGVGYSYPALLADATRVQP